MQTASGGSNYVEWNYTDGNNGLIKTVTSGNGIARFDSDGLYLQGGSSAWSFAQAVFDLPFSIGSRSVSIEVEYSNASSPYTNCAIIFFPGTAETDARLYVQNSNANIMFANGSTSQSTDISTSYGSFPNSGLVKTVYSHSQNNVSIVKDNAIVYSGTVYKTHVYDHNFEEGIICETQTGSSTTSSRRPKIKILRAKLVLED